MHCGDQRHAGLCLGWRPCTSHRRVQGCSQGTTLSASDLHNAQATILNPFYNMEYKIIKKIRLNTVWIEADILGINSPIPTMHSPQPLSMSAMTSQSHSTLWCHNSNTNNVSVIACEWDRNRLKSMDRCSNLSLFLYVQGLIHECLIVFIWRVIRWNYFNKMWHISLPCILQNNNLQC